MYLEHLVPPSLAGLFLPGCLIKRLRYPHLVSFGMLANLKRLAGRGVFEGVDSIVDVGANIGQFAFMAHSALPGLPIYSFEPDPGCFAGLQQTFADYHISGGGFPFAVSSKEGSVSLNVYESAANNSLLSRHGETAVSVHQVRCTTLDALLNGELSSLRAPFLKIDVQGAELSVLAGAAEFLKRCRYVMLETSLVPSYEGCADVAHVLSFMDSAGFACWEIVDVLRKRKPDELGIQEMDLLFVRKGEAHAG